MDIITQSEISKAYDEWVKTNNELSLQVRNKLSNYEHVYTTILQRINQQKNDILSAKLKELNIDIDLEAEHPKRFKSIVSEIKDSKETYYYNDGSNTGLRIVTFWVELLPPINMSDCNTILKLYYC